MKKPILDRNILIVKTHGHIQNEREKLLAFEREDAMRSRLEEALAANKEMGDQLERFRRLLVKANEQIDALNQAAIDGDDMPI